MKTRLYLVTTGHDENTRTRELPIIQRGQWGWNLLVNEKKNRNKFQAEISLNFVVLTKKQSCKKSIDTRNLLNMRASKRFYKSRVQALNSEEYTEAPKNRKTRHVPPCNVGINLNIRIKNNIYKYTQLIDMPSEGGNGYRVQFFTSSCIILFCSMVRKA